MFVDTRIFINRKARLNDVAEVMGILAGLKPEKQAFSSHIGSYTKVDGVKTEGIENLPECSRILLKAKEGETLVDEQRVHDVLWHWEPEGNSDFHLMRPRSTPFWIAIGIELINFFGGEIDYADCDETDIDYITEGSQCLDDISDGEGWETFQKAMFNVTPLTTERIKELDPEAEYHD